MAPLYSSPQKLPSMIVRGVATALTCPLYSTTDYNTLVVPTSGTFTLTGPDGVATVSAATVTITDGVATYSVTSSTTAELSRHWLETWTLTVAGVVHTFVRTSALVRFTPYPVLTRANLIDGRNQWASKIAQQGILELYISAAWDDVLRDLMTDDRDPWKNLDPWALYHPHLHRAEFLLWKDAGPDYEARAGQALAEYSSAMKRLVLTSDASNDGLPTAAEQTAVYRPGLVTRSSRWG